MSPENNIAVAKEYLREALSLIQRGQLVEAEQKAANAKFQLRCASNALNPAGARINGEPE